MKTLKSKVLIGMLLLLWSMHGFAQENKPTMYVVHEDHVNFEMAPQYEQSLNEFRENVKKHNIGGIDWVTISINDGRYVHVSKIDSFADLDENAMAPLVEKMGKEAFGTLLNKMDACYDSHQEYIVYHLPELSYMPEGAGTGEGENYREYHFVYYTPKNAKAMKEAMLKIKELFEQKKSKMAYNIFKSGFGNPENYYMVSVASKDEVALAKSGMENDNVLGEEREAIFFNMIKLASRYDKLEGEIRPDLSYASPDNP